MNGEFTRRLRAAVVAGWWTVAIWVIFLTISWLIYLCIMHTRPEWLRTLWGGGIITWEKIQTVYIWFFGAFKVVLWAVLMVTVFLTLWARNLKKAA